MVSIIFQLLKLKAMIKYSLKERINPMDLTAPNKYYPVKQSQDELNLRDFAKRISRESSLSSMDVMAVLEGLLQIIPDEIMNGKIIKLGDFGTFRTTISSDGADTPEEFTVGKIKSLNIRFRPSREFRNQLASVKYEKV
jgi:predicted histone-like DNA-binding protein